MVFRVYLQMDALNALGVANERINNTLLSSVYKYYDLGSLPYEIALRVRSHIGYGTVTSLVRDFHTCSS